MGDPLHYWVLGWDLGVGVTSATRISVRDGVVTVRAPIGPFLAPIPVFSLDTKRAKRWKAP